MTEAPLFLEDAEPGFLSDLAVQPQDDGRTWVTLEPLRWKNGKVYTVPRFFVTDFASIPIVMPSIATLLLSWILSFWIGDLAAGCIAALLASQLGLTPFGRHQWAAVLHDYLYFSHEVERAEADWIFFLAMKDKGVLLTKRWCMYWSVRVFGAPAWHAKRGEGTNRVLEFRPKGKARTGERGFDRLITAGVLLVKGRAA